MKNYILNKNWFKNERKCGISKAIEIEQFNHQNNTSFILEYNFGGDRIVLGKACSALGMRRAPKAVRAKRVRKRSGPRMTIDFNLLIITFAY